METKWITVLLIISLTVSFTTFAYAENALTKLGRGLVNAATGWLEIPKQIYNNSKDKNVVIGITIGTAKGIGWGIARTAIGIYEIVTFPFPMPIGYKYILEPEYVFSFQR